MGRVTLEDIARMANVSKSTVSRVLNQKYDGVGVETRRRVLSVIKRLDYEPNLHTRGPAVTQSKILGVVIPDISNPSVSAVVRSIAGFGSLHCRDGNGGSERRVIPETCAALEGLPHESVPHETFKQLAARAKSVIRTGETTPFANVILVGGVNF